MANKVSDLTDDEARFRKFILEAMNLHDSLKDFDVRLMGARNAVSNAENMSPRAQASFVRKHLQVSINGIRSRHLLLRKNAPAYIGSMIHALGEYEKQSPSKREPRAKRRRSDIEPKWYKVDDAVGDALRRYEQSGGELRMMSSAQRNVKDLIATMVRANPQMTKKLFSRNLQNRIELITGIRTIS